MLTFGHRGASGYAPENTLTSFKKALEFAIDAIELDVHLSKDNHLVVIHDKTVNRTTNGKGNVADKTLAELQKLDAGNGEKIPTLQEVLDLINKKTQVNIELKGKNIAPAVEKIIEDYVKKNGWRYSDFLVSAFNHSELRTLKQLLPQLKIGVLIRGIWVQFDEYTELDAYSLHVWSKLIRKAIIEKAHKRGMKVFAYTVNDIKEITRMKNLGVDGVFSDYPDKVI